MMSVFRFFLLHSIFLCCISLSVKLSTANILGNETDKLALLAFKSQITQDPFEAMRSWNGSYHFCEWEGVRCSRRHQRVTALIIRSKALAGTISPQTGNLSFLRTLNLYNNSFHGEIPPEFGKLFRLKVLFVSANSLVGEIPVSISNCSSLMALFLNENNLVGKIPMELGSLSKLVSLTLHSNKLTGGIPPSLGNLTSLQFLSMSVNNFGGSVPSTLGQLKSLKAIALGQCKLSGLFPPSIFNISTLEIVSIELNYLTGELPNGLVLLSLRLFLMGGNEFSRAIPSSLFNSSQRIRIDMGFNNFCGKVPLSVGNLQNLNYLGMQGNSLGSEKSGDLDFFTSLSNCTSLQILLVSTNQFGGTIPLSIGNLPNQLSEMYLGANRLSGNIPPEIGNLQNLTLIDLHGNSLTGSIPMEIGKLQKLQKLYLFENQLSRQLPSSLRNLPQLFFLDMSLNFLEGTIAPSLAQSMQTLLFSYNNFTGTIPGREIGLSSQLRTLNMSHNAFIGSIPTEVGNLKSLQGLDVSENRMSGEIPSQLGDCSSLEYLYIQGNVFQGPLPNSLTTLKGLQVMDVSRNNITGQIPEGLENLALQKLNLSFNNLEGEVPIDGIFSNASAFSVDGNEKICGGISALQLPICYNQSSKKHGIPLSLKVVLGVLAPSLLLVALFVVICLRKKPKTKYFPEQLPGDLKRVSYNDLCKATDGFSSANLVGMGSYGSVYKGILRPYEDPIAVKVLNLREHGASKSFMVECEALRGVRHRNLLNILTVCSSVDFNGNDFKALVFTFMPKGSLESWLHPSSDGQMQPERLNFHQRLNIAIDIASALDYLHNRCERPIVHCDLKASNVLLGNDLTAHVCDFGLAKFLSKNNRTSNRNDTNSIALRGTIGYIPPEYAMGAEVTTYGDVYSYGVLLLEMFTGKRPTDDMFRDGHSLPKFSKMALPHEVMNIIDMHLITKESRTKAANSVNGIREYLTSILRIGVICSEDQMTERMEIQDVLKEMHLIKENFLSVRPSTAKILGNETDRLALLAFKSQITLDPYNIVSSWNDSLHFCEWEGIKCNHKHQRVTVLKLSSNGLLGSLSPHLGNLSFLTTLVLYDNRIQGEIPEELGHLSRLTHLIVSNNSLVGKIPNSHSHCSNLKNLFLSYNNLVGKIPTELGSLSKLVTLALHRNRLTGGIPHSLGNLTSLESLSISENNLGGTIPTTLGELKSLKAIGLGVCNLSGIFLASLYNLSNLEIISNADNQPSGSLPSNIGFMLPSLTNFLIGINQFSGPIPTSLSNASKLQKIDFGNNQFTGEVPINLGNLIDLQFLNFEENRLGSGTSGDLDFFTSLSNCTSLEFLSVRVNQFGGLLPASVANFSSILSELYIGDNQLSGNIPIEIENLQNLIAFDLTNNIFTGSIPAGIGNLQKLGMLYLYGNRLSEYIPSSIGNMSQLFYLDMSYNFLEGSIASSLGNQILQTLDLSYNNLTGPIPNQEIGLSTRLVTLTLSHNSLNGSIPLELGNLQNLQGLDVSENKMSGQIPNQLGNCLSLEYLYIQGNFFQGSLPNSLSSLKGLQVMDVSRNNLSGKIPKELENLAVLKSLNLSFNNFEGEVPTKGIFSNASAVSIDGNYKLCGGISELKLPKCNIQKSGVLKKKGSPLSLKVVPGVLVLSVIVVALFLMFYLKKKPDKKPPKEQLMGDIKRVSYYDLNKATNGFSLENLIGTGSYGSVYKGILQQDEGPIAVKVLNLTEPRASKSFMAECEALREIRHRNLLKILTVCSSVDSNGNDFKALVLKFMPNGSLESWLHTSSNNGQDLMRTLNLFQRVNIAIDVASALDYLHNECERPIVHCDLKSSNVLLDEDMTSNVGDFGLAKFLSKSTSTSNKNKSNSIAIRGTIGYIPPEYGMGAQVSAQGDVYSYGILLLEIFTGKRPTDHMFKEGLTLHDFSKKALPQQVMDIIDTRLLEEDTLKEVSSSNPVNGTIDCLSRILRVGVACSEELMIERMDIKDVLKELHSIKETLSVGTQQ